MEARSGQTGAGPSLIIGIGRDFLDGRDSRGYLHGSTGLWEALTSLDGSLEAAPWLATSWRSEQGGRRWIFTLRGGVLFHDGTPMRASDVAASIRRIASNPKYDPGGGYKEFESVVARGDEEVVVTLKRPVPFFPKVVAYYGSPVFKADCLDASGRIVRPVATGPFQLASARAGDRVVLEAFEGHWGARPHFGSVTFRTIPDPQTRLLSLRTGEIDAIVDIGGILPEQAELLHEEPGIVVKRREVATTHQVVFNCSSPVFSSPESRKRFAAAIDAPGLVAAFVPGGGVRARDPYSDLATAWCFGLFDTPRQPDEADFRPAQTVRIVLHGGVVGRWPYLPLAQAIQAALRERGVAATITLVEGGAYHDTLRKGAFDLAIEPYTLMTGDPDFFYSYLIASDAPRNTGYKNPEADALIRRAREEMDPEARRGLYRRLEAIMAAELPVLPLYHDLSCYALRDTVELDMDALFKPNLTEANRVHRP